jgi:rhodanese-related sulfurtransferase
VNVATPELAGLVDQAKLTPTALLLIDPRSRAEYEAGRIPTARNMPVTTFRTDRKRDPRIERFDQIVVYGKDPASPIGRATTKRLVELGYGNVRFYGGGMEEWTLSGLAVEAGE